MASRSKSRKRSTGSKGGSTPGTSSTPKIPNDPRLTSNDPNVLRAVIAERDATISSLRRALASFGGGLSRATSNMNLTSSDPAFPPSSSSSSPASPPVPDAPSSNGGKRRGSSSRKTSNVNTSSKSKSNSSSTTPGVVPPTPPSSIQPSTPTAPSPPITNAVAALDKLYGKVESQLKEARGLDPAARLAKEKSIVHSTCVDAFSPNVVSSMGALIDRPGMTHVVFLTTAPKELFAILQAIQSSGPHSGLTQVTADPWVYYLAKWEGHNVVVVKSTQGTDGPESATPTVAAAIQEWSPRLVLAVGFAFGTMPPPTTHYGDVVFASALFPYNLRRITGKEAKSSFSNPIRPAQPAVAAAFAGAAASPSSPTIRFGTVVSGNVLADSETYVSGLLNNISAALPDGAPPIIAGEMEGSGLYDACTAGGGVPCALVKSICDYGGLDGAKDKSSQSLAAVNAVAAAAAALRWDSGSWVSKLPIPTSRSLKKLSFDVFIADKTRGFVGRKGLFKRLHAWRKGSVEDGGTVLIVKGDPGLGKSAFLATLCTSPEHSHTVASYHFCRYDVPITMEPRVWLGNVTRRLLDWAVQHDPPIEIPDPARNAVSVTLADASTRVSDGFAAFLASLPRRVPGMKEPVIIAVDSLDEAADTAPGREVIACLVAAVPVLPSWLKIVATSRKDELVLRRLLPPLKAVSIEATSEENMADVTLWVNARVKDGPTAAAVVKASGGNFLYVRQLLDGQSEATVKAMVSAGKLPDGLASLYTVMARRLYPTASSFQAILPMLGILVAAAGPLPRSILADAAPKKPKPDDVLRSLSSVLEATASTVRIYHKSFADWAISDGWKDDTDIRSLDSHVVDLSVGHAQLAKACAKAGPTDAYARSHTVEHAVAAADLETLRATALSWEWMKARAGADGIPALAENLVATASVRSWPAGKEREVVRMLARVVTQFRDVESVTALGDLLFLYLGKDNAGAPALSKALASTRLLQPTTTRRGNSALDARLQTGGRTAINAVTTLEDGRRVVSAGKDASIHVWDVASGEEIMVMAGTHTQSVNALAVYEPESWIVSGSSDGTVAVWSAAVGGTPMAVLPGEQKVHSLCVIPAPHEAIVVGSQHRIIRVWTRKKDQKKDKWSFVECRKHTLAVFALVHIKDDMFASGSGDKAVCIWKTSQYKKPIAYMKVHTKRVSALAIRASDKALISASEDGSVRDWGPGPWTDSTQPRIIAQARELIKSMCPVGDAQAVATGAKNKQLLWLGGGTKGSPSTIGVADAVLAMAPLPDGRIVTGGDSGSLTLWNPSEDTSANADETGGAGTSPLQLAPLENGRVASSNEDGSVTIYPDNTVVGSNQETVKSSNPRIFRETCICAVPGGGGALVSGGDDRRGRVWTRISTEERAQKAAPKTAVPASEQVADSGMGWRKNRAKMWEELQGDGIGPGSWRMSRALRGHSGVLGAMAVTPNGQVIVSAADDVQFRIWSTRVGSWLARPYHVGKPIKALLCITNDLFVSGDLDGRVLVWSLKDAGVRNELAGEDSSAPVRSLALSGDGKYLVAADDSGRVRSWLVPKLDKPDVVWPQPRELGDGHHGSRVRCATGMSGSLVATGGADSRLRIWDCAKGKELNVLAAQGEVRSLCWAGKESLLSAVIDREIIQWNWTGPGGKK